MLSEAAQDLGTIAGQRGPGELRVVRRSAVWRSENEEVSHEEAGMSSRISRRTLIKSTGAAAALVPALKASKVFHAPTVLAQSGPVKPTYRLGFTGALADSQ